MDQQQQEIISQYQLLLNIHKKINISMDKKHIFSVILSELLPAIHAEKGAIQVKSSNETIISYYGYTVKEGIAVWEPDETTPCPESMRDIVNALSDAVSVKKHRKAVCTSNIIFSGLYSNKKNSGYIAVVYNSLIEQSQKEHLCTTIEEVGSLIAHILEQKIILEQKKNLEKISLIRTMLSTLSHDIKNPLSGISGFAQLIGQRSTNESIKKYCNIILDSCLQLEDTLNTLRIILSGEALTLCKSTLSLKTMLIEVVGQVEEIYKHEGIDITVSCDRDVLFEADKEKFLKILKAMLKNAKEAMPGGGKIHITLKEDNSSAKIEIADTGRGMPVHIQESVFKPFYTFGKENATGLGLTIVKKIIEEHGGAISFSSSVNKGTTFTINLPIEKKEAER